MVSSGRIQRLLYSEYSELEDVILVESPFAETTRDGNGLQQVYLGLTHNHLIVAADMIKPVEIKHMLYCRDVDPVLDDFELVSIYPLLLVHISVYCLRKKHVLKIHFCNNVVRYFELGGSEKKTYWKLWCEHIKFLCPDNPGSSQSETSACSISTSSFSSVVCLASSKVVRKPSGALRIWQHFQSEGSGDQTLVPQKMYWAQKNQFFGKKYEKLLPQADRALSSRSEMQLVYKNEHFKEDSENDLRRSSSSEPYAGRKQFIINRFGLGIPENCTTALIMKPMKDLPAEQDQQFSTQKSDVQAQKGTCTIQSPALADQPAPSLEDLLEVCVRVWETRPSGQKRIHHLRRYGLEPLPFFFRGLGLEQVIPGDRYTLQMKRSPSLVTLCDSAEPQLTPEACASYQGLPELRSSLPPSHLSPQYRAPLVLFWTPGFSYKPVINTRGIRTPAGRLLRQRAACSSKGHTHNCQDKSDINFQNALKSHLMLSSWEFDSKTLACQLTIIDRNLFLRIPTFELEMISQQRSSKNAFNVRAVIWFSSRVASLVASQVLNEKSVKIRVRLVCRYINVAHKCYLANNFQSCRSVVAGLQSPPIYMLHQTWAIIRKHYISRYRMFEEMCRHYCSPWTRVCREEFKAAVHDLPFLPFVGCLLACLTTDATVAWWEGPVWSPFQVTGRDSCTFFEPVCTDAEVNAARLKKVYELLVESQKAANRFQLPPNKVAQNFLLKTRYRVDVENFFHYSIQEETLTPGTKN